ncbi:MAG: succinyl-diaminopimelate desuccinylase [Magnetococcus sp. DMHC-6]
MDPTLALTQELIRIPSVTPQDHGCQEIIARELSKWGFRITRLKFGKVENLYARIGQQGTHFCFAGHTDVVPSGDPALWQTPPFAAQVTDGVLIGRGASDMKGGVAAMITAAQRFLADHPHFPKHHSLSFLITGDEEAEAIDGTQKVLQWMEENGEKIDYCLVGEPSCQLYLGDCIKIGRRGSINGQIVLHGMQGHAAYPHLAKNPIHLGFVPLLEIARLELDQGDSHFQPSSLQFTGVASGGLSNVIPASLQAIFNIRFNTCHTPDSLEQKIRSVLDQSQIPYELTMTVSGLPFISEQGELLAALIRVIEQNFGCTPQLSTGGGTSDARFIERYCHQTVEFGLVAQGIHKTDEGCPVEDPHRLSTLFKALLEDIYALR